jgi:hypothetical protein
MAMLRKCRQVPEHPTPSRASEGLLSPQGCRRRESIRDQAGPQWPLPQSACSNRLDHASSVASRSATASLPSSPCNRCSRAPMPAASEVARCAAAGVRPSTPLAATRADYACKFAHDAQGIWK